MLPGFRFAIGAFLAFAVLGVTSVGLLTAARLTGYARVGPLQASRNVAFADRTDWNPFYHPDSARRFEELARKEGQTAADHAGGAVAMSREADVSGPQVEDASVDAVAQLDGAAAETPTGSLAREPDAPDDAVVVVEPPPAVTPEEPAASTPEVATHDPTSNAARPAPPLDEPARAQSSAGPAEHLPN